MRKLAPVILVVILLINSGGLFIWYSYKLFNIKENIEEQIRSGALNEKLSVIAVPEKSINEIQWTEKGKEFKFNDNMYDVVKTEKANGEIIFYCINDIQEKNLIGNYAKNQSARKEAEKKVKTRVTLQIVPDPFSIVKIIPFEFIAYSKLSLNYTSVFSKNSSPPPRHNNS